VKDGFIKPTKVKWIEILRRQAAATYCRDVKQLRERHEMRVLRCEANTRECSVIATPVSSVLRQKKRVVNAAATPERYTVSVVLQYAMKRRRILEIRVVVCV
jgi:hypothetical protein